MPRQLSVDRDHFISDIYLDLGGQTGDPEVRTWALDHAVRVDAKRGEGHEFGRQVLRRVLTRSLSDYFVRTGVVIPAEDATAPDTNLQKLGSDRDMRVAQSVIRAFGAPEGGFEITPPDPTDSGVGGIVAIASYDLTVPGMSYLRTAVEVISWPRENTLFV